ncbi:unnamed protein product [Nezara viridula]|uniref:Neuropeptide n=1 Tax=Nezara viridula TaxID=85310 RepID=A0A9P0HGG8_NEZVI|nr:unnamed protein product [Nezara viridula]
MWVLLSLFLDRKIKVSAGSTPPGSAPPNSSRIVIASRFWLATEREGEFENGIMHAKTYASKRRSTKISTNCKLEEEILDAIQLSPITSTRRFSRHFDVSSTSVCRTSLEQRLYTVPISRIE